jgi:hypothetical protein
VSGLVNDLVNRQAAHDVVRCSGIGDDGPCGREQTVSSYDDGIGVRVVAAVPEETSDWLSSFGWRRDAGSRWLCPFCSGFGEVCCEYA